MKPPLHGSSSMPPGEMMMPDGDDSMLDVLGTDSPYAKLQKLGPPPAGMISVPKTKKKQPGATSRHTGSAASLPSSAPKKRTGKKKKKLKGQDAATASSSRFQPKNVMLSEEELSASAASHRDFLLQTLHNVRNQLANPSPLIVSGLAVQEEEVGAHRFR